LLSAPERANVCDRLLNHEFVSSDSQLVLQEKQVVENTQEHIVRYQKYWAAPLNLSEVPHVGSGTTVYLPLYGMYGNSWYDGPIFRLSSEGEVLSFVSQGFPARLMVPTESSAVPPPEQPKSLVDDSDLLNSATQIAAHLANDCSQLELVVNIADFSLATVVALVLVKKAHPQRSLIAKHSLDYKSWPSEWKRLCQNLGMSQYEWRDSAADFDLNLLVSMIRPSSLILAYAINHRSDVIPRNLIEGKAPDGVREEV